MYFLTDDNERARWRNGNEWVWILNRFTSKFRSCYCRGRPDGRHVTRIIVLLVVMWAGDIGRKQYQLDTSVANGNTGDSLSIKLALRIVAIR